MPEIIQPLDLETVFINVLAGSTLIFVFVALIFTSILAARFKMPSVVYGMMLVLLSIVLQNHAGGLFIIGLVLTGLATFFIMAKLFDR